MSNKVAVVVTAASDTPEGRGRMVHAMVTAQGLIDQGSDVKILFEGIGVTWLTAFHENNHLFTEHYQAKFESIKPLIAGACDFCSKNRFETSEAVEALGLNHLGEVGHHYSVGNLVTEGYQVITY